MAEDNRAGMLDLISKKLAEIFQIHFALLGIYDRGKAVQYGIVGMNILHGANYVTELANAGRLDQNAIGMKSFQHLGKRTAEISNQAAANAARIHFGDLYTRFLQKTAINTDLAELIFNKNDPLANVGFLEHLFDQRGFTGTQKA